MVLEGGGGSGGNARVNMQREHIVFVDSKRAVRKFSAAKHFDTAPELVGRAHNRPRMETLRTQAVVQPGSEKVLEKMERKREAGYVTVRVCKKLLAFGRSSVNSSSVHNCYSSPCNAPF